MGARENEDSSSTPIDDIKTSHEAEGMRVHKNVLCSDQYTALKFFYSQAQLFILAMQKILTYSFLKGQINHNSVYKL
jgi:hypothetical protein